MQSVFDTIGSAAVGVFLGLIAYLVLSFAVAYHIAFGEDVQAHSFWNLSVYVDSFAWITFLE